MYKKSESVLPFYSQIEKKPQAQICHLDMCLRESGPVFSVSSFLLIFRFHSVNSIYSLKKYTTRLILQSVCWRYVHSGNDKVSYYVTSSEDPSRSLFT